MLGDKLATYATHSPKTLVRTAVQAYGITLLSSKGNENRCGLQENLFIIIRIQEFYVIGFQHARCHGSRVSSSFPRNARQNCCSSLVDNFLSSNTNGNRCDLHKKHNIIIIIRTYEFDV